MTMNKIFIAVEKILASGVEQVTLTRKQALILTEFAKRISDKKRDTETKRLRLAMHRAEEALKAVADRLDKERKQ
jgi:hypothetical protein